MQEGLALLQYGRDALDDVLQQRAQWVGQSALFLEAEATQYSYGGFVCNFLRG